MPDTDHGRLTLRGIEIFLTVAEAGTLGEGARRLGAAASTVSQQIANLETALGVALIDRGARPLTLTPAGRLFHARAVRIVDEVAGARADISTLDTSAVRALTLASIEDLEGAVLSDLLARLGTVFGACNFAVSTGHSHQNLAALEGRTADLIITAGDSDTPDWVERHLIVRDPLILVTAPGLVPEGDDPLHHLPAAPMIRFNRAQHIARQIEAHLRRVNFVAPPRFEVETNKAMLALVARVRGWAVTTPLGLLSVGGDAVEAWPLPFPKQSRILSLSARREVMGTLPGAVAGVLRDVVGDFCIRPGRARMPWLGDQFRVLGVEEAET